MIYFTADSHFGDEYVIRFGDRPFDSVKDMNKALIKNWNDVVRCDDEIYILGDFTSSSRQVMEFLPVLNGIKYIVAGNHDKFFHESGEKQAWSECVEWVKDYAEINHNGFKYILFHYPIAEWNGFYHGSIHLYGHIHKKPAALFWNPSKIRAFNVGADVNGYKPVSIDEIIKRASKIPLVSRKSAKKTGKKFNLTFRLKNIIKFFRKRL